MTEPKTVERRIPLPEVEPQDDDPPARHSGRRRELQESDLLSKFTSETGKILPRRVTGVSAKLHRKITRSIKRSRAVNLMP